MNAVKSSSRLTSPAIIAGAPPADPRQTACPRDLACADLDQARRAEVLGRLRSALSSNKTFNKFDTIDDQVARDFDEYELERETAGPVFQLGARMTF